MSKKIIGLIVFVVCFLCAVFYFNYTFYQPVKQRLQYEEIQCDISYRKYVYAEQVMYNQENAIYCYYNVGYSYEYDDVEYKMNSQIRINFKYGTEFDIYVLYKDGEYVEMVFESLSDFKKPLYIGNAVFLVILLSCAGYELIIYFKDKKRTFVIAQRVRRYKSLGNIGDNIELVDKE